MPQETRSSATIPQVKLNITRRGDGHDVDHSYCQRFLGRLRDWKGVGSLQGAPNATFAAQAEPLVGIKTLAEYTDWMKGLMTIMPDGSYEVKSFATDAERNSVAAYAVFSGTHTGDGGPCEPTGKKTTSDYFYVMQFTGDKISHMTKIWHSGMALKELGWA
jgi:SnoaL-like polyketide cyclase